MNGSMNTDSHGLLLLENNHGGGCEKEEGVLKKKINVKFLDIDPDSAER